MRYFTFAFMCIVLLHIQAAAQEKKRLSHDDYDHWKNLSGIEISVDGNHVLYTIEPQRHDGDLFIMNPNNHQQKIIPRGARASFSPGGKFAVFHIQPQRDVVRQAKVEKTRRENMPKDSLGIYVMGNEELLKYEDVISYRLPKEPSDWLAFALILQESLRKWKRRRKLFRIPFLPMFRNP